MPEQARRNVQVLVSYLEIIRQAAGAPILVTSGYRSPAHNQSIPGAGTWSEHMNGKAADIRAAHGRFRDPRMLAGLIEGLINIGAIPDGGVGLYDTHVHYDFAEPRRWGFA